jgi:hypothetical protein
MNRKLLIVLGVGALAYYFWYMNKKSKSVNIEDVKSGGVKKSSVKKLIPPNVMDVEEVDGEVIIREVENREKNKYTNAFKRKFNIKIPAVQASKEVKKAAIKMQDRRYKRQLEAQLEKPELYI